MPTWSFRGALGCMTDQDRDREPRDAKDESQDALEGEERFDAG
ncbi:hypothetical protein GCM10023169_25880 [Georgenia halophila]|uniref:Uncharacterized protein n=1 Tax=Georgenia halophila TaxID=620889 RepID=A0ABP8LE83_9MICO